MADDDQSELIDWIKQELIKGLNKTYLEEVDGPAIYGKGNFEVFEGEGGNWYMRPKPGWTPTNLTGFITDPDEYEGKE